MKTLVVKIETLKSVNEFQQFYHLSSEQENEEMLTSIKNEGQKVPIIINSDNYIIDGYRRVEALKQLGIEDVTVNVVDDTCTLKSRILFNTYRKKTITDEITEIKAIFSNNPKRQGVRSLSGSYSRHEVISKELNNRWKGDKTLKKVEYIIENDFDNNVLLTGILSNGWSIDACYEYLNDLKPFDLVNDYGITPKLWRGEINIKQAVSFIKDKDFLKNKYKDTFVIPGKVNAYKLDCGSISDIEEHLNSVDLVFTSPPYFILRNYYNGEGKSQKGQEKSAEEYCENIANLIAKIVPTLKETANVMINIGETYDDGVGYGIPDMLSYFIRKKTGLIYKDRLVWSKPNPKPMNETVRRPINNLEYILWFVVNPDEAKYNLLTYTDKVKDVKISRGAKDVDATGKLWDTGISLSKPYKKIYSHLDAQDVSNMIRCATGANPEVNKIVKDGHPAIMAALLPVVPILMCTDEDDVVFDPFAGSNVVGRITCLLNRKSLSTELSKLYHSIGCKMLENALEDYNENDYRTLKKLLCPKQNDNSMAA